MAVEGSLDLFQLPEILQIISQEQKTGILTVQGQNDIVAISFLAGEVVTADALNQTLEDDLGEVLISRGSLTRPELEEALVEQRRTGRRLMDVLVAQERIEREEVLEALRSQTVELLHRLLHWREGEFKFYSGDEVSYEEGFRPIRVDSLLLAALGREEETEGEAEAEELPAPAAAPTLPPSTAAPPSPPSPARESQAPPTSAGMPDLGEVPLHPGEPEPKDRPSPPPRPTRPARPARWVRAGETTPGRRGRRASPAPSGRQGLGWAVALVAVAGLLTVATLRPTLLLVPFPFEEEARLAFEDSRWTVRYAKLEAALRSHALAAGRMPEDLGALVAAGLLSEGEIQGPLGQPLVYQADGLNFSFRPLGSGEQVAYGSTLEGDFLLDPEFLENGDAAAVQPLVLLD